MMKLMERIRSAPGNVAMYYRPLEGGCAQMYNADEPLLAASVIKLPIMVEAFRQFEAGLCAPEEKVVLREEDKLPSCGALNCLHAGLELTLMDLVRLMIVLSDNTATNLLIDRLGMANINATMVSMGMRQSVLRRKLFDSAGRAAGIENTVSAREIGALLEGLYGGTLVSPEASAQMLEILRNQKLNGKLPFYLKPRGVAVAHKTGEDDGITHDVGIIYTPQPFVLCMLSNETDVPAFERLIQDAARELADMNQ